jgi:hypothetical protein
MIDKRGSSVDNALPRTMKRLQILLLSGFDRNEPHRRARSGFVNSFCIRRVVLGPFDEGLHKPGIQALADVVHSADVVLNILARRRDPGLAVTILTPEAFAFDTPPPVIAPATINLEALGPMERTEVLDMMSGLKFYGMRRSAYDETLATAIKRKHEPQRFVGDLLKAEISEKQARSIKYQLTVAKLPLAKDVDDFAFNNTPINDALVRDPAAGGFIVQQRNVVLVGRPELAS